MSRTREELKHLAHAVRARLEMEKWFGVTSTPAPRPPSAADRERRLAEVEAEVQTCRACRLNESRTSVVFGEGNPDADILFIGEAPGADEDRQGRPFVGRAGKLLDRIIVAMGLKREEVYIANVLKCRPPGNRNPQPDEASCCLPFLKRQIEIIQPRIIVSLGGVCATHLLGTTESVGRLRGAFHDYQGIPVLVTYHPAYLLRNPSAKAMVWEDMKTVLRALGRPIPNPRRQRASR